ncbi:MAG: MotA/TolQ/ExbB proton channel family protein [Bacteroidia bacterium]
MKKVFTLLALSGMLVFNTNTYAQDGEAAADSAIVAQEAPAEAEAAEEVPATEEPIEEAEQSVSQAIKTKFIEGGPEFMALVLICLILGLALAIERIIYLNMASVNTAKLLADIEAALKSGGVNAAKEVCRNTRGPIAAIFYQGLDRAGDGENVEAVEKAIVQYGGVQTGLLEKGLSWIALFIALAPMLGFLGTVIGMIQAFDSIEKAGEMNATDMASGIKVALITTVAGLIVAMFLQVFYNYIVAKIDGLVNQMEDASITMVDMLIKHNVSSK